MVVGDNGGGSEDETSFSSSSDESWESDSSTTTISSEDATTSSVHDDSSTDESEEYYSPSIAPVPATSVKSAIHDGDVSEDDCNDDCYGDGDSWGVREWTERVPIGMNLCPWAKLSHKEGRIRYVTCPDGVQTPRQASAVVWKEIDRLLGKRTGTATATATASEHSPPPQEPRSLPAWSTTLVICPHVHAWKDDFPAFETFVREFGKESESLESSPQATESTPQQLQHRHQSNHAITLVPFHPQFLRWRGLPETVTVGSPIRCHKGLAGFVKSPTAHSATVLDLSPPGFGRRRLRVRFHEESSTAQEATKTVEQCIPLDWVVLKEEANHRPPLPDNAMHRAPHPVIHILRNRDLEALSIHEISRLKRRNAKRMMAETL